MKTKTHIDRDALVASITKIEGGKNPPKNLSSLFKAVAEDLGTSPGAVMGRINDYGITVATKPGRRVGVKEEPIEQEQEKKENPKIEPGIDLTPFTSRGIIVRNIDDLYTSALKDDNTNKAIMAAIVEIRRTKGLPALSREDFQRLKGEN